MYFYSRLLPRPMYVSVCIIHHRLLSTTIALIQVVMTMEFRGYQKIDNDEIITCDGRFLILSRNRFNRAVGLHNG